uniref:Inositol polyphosphate-related phosphatase domain-containing protein n=2 Tax=Babesia bovis TaxID=5865 RepID=A7ASJ6_BABBO|eukprot:XP_001611083.1 hypothetical protein [Babesia bovis T2Bo]
MFYLNTTTNSIQSYDVSYSLNPNRNRDLSKQHDLRDEDSWPINYSDVGFVRARRDAIQRRLADNTSQKDVFVESPIVPKYVSRKTDTNGFFVLDKSKTSFPPINERKVPVNHSKSPLIRLRQSTIQLKPLTEEDNEPLNDWIPMGYDIYIISLQETLSCGMFISITKYLLRQSNEDYVRIPLENDKLSGHGDGAFLKTKSTSIAVWIRKELLDSKIVEMGPSRSIPISRINRSKGLVTFQMKVYNHLVCVVGCHLPTGRKSREKAIKQVIGKLCYVYGVSGSSLHDVFHHILWTGDFNFRVSNISTRQALMLLNNGHVQELFCNDEFYSRGASLFADMKFEEGVVRFFPTYKMRDDRDVADHSKDNWADSAYHTLYETHWYKGGNVKDRVPSWTDRVLKWSIPELRTCLQIDDTTYTSVQPNDKNILLTSDHSPVGCGLALWPVKSPEMLVPRKNLSLIG